MAVGHIWYYICLKWNSIERCKLFVTASPMYRLLGKDITCDSSTIYTFSPDNGCDGWSGLSLHECQEKCKKNEQPNSNCPHQNAVCKYFTYNTQTKWCHLAEHCTQVEGNGVLLYIREENWIHQPRNGEWLSKWNHQNRNVDLLCYSNKFEWRMLLIPN